MIVEISQFKFSNQIHFHSFEFKYASKYPKSLSYIDVDAWNRRWHRKWKEHGC